jgi:hypothetical protein
MLNSTTVRQLSEIKAALSIYVEAAFSSYENTVGKFEVSKNRKIYVDGVFNLYTAILDRIIEEKTVTILPLTFKITAALISFGFNLERFLTILVTVNGVIKAGYVQSGPRNITIEQYLDSYINEILSSQTGLTYYLEGLKSEQQIQLIEEYAPSTVIIDDVILKDNLVGRTIYTLFGEDLYWEVIRKKYIDQKYPTNRLTIYQDRLYVLNQGYSRPTAENFIPDEWGEYNSKFLTKSNLFNNKLKINTERYISEALAKSGGLNAIISDSKIQEEVSGLIYDEKDLSVSFAGRGKDIIQNILQLKETIKYFGGSEASPVGSIDYIAKFAEYIYSCNYARVINTGYYNIEGISLFGLFNLIFSYDFGVNKIAGLKYLENFKSLASFKQGITLPEEVIIEKLESEFRVVYNPLYAKYKEGLRDRFISYPKNIYVDSPTNIGQESDNYAVDVLLFGLQSINTIAGVLGDTIGSLDSALDKNGALPGYEGLGPISSQIGELKTVFVSSNVFETNYANAKILPGLNGATKNLLDSYKKLTEVVPNVPLTGESLNNLSIWARNLQKSLERITSDLSSIGFMPGSFIPNISFKFSPKEQDSLIDQLRSLNFQESEIIQFLSVGSFEEMIEKFAPVSDSEDQISFFKGYELSQLIYEFGGESAIDAYINYLYAPDETGLVNLLKISLKDQSDASVYNQSRYGKLIGLLINLTFAIDPVQLDIYKEYLSGNFLTLFESISYLLETGNANLLKDKDSISLLEPIANSLIYGDSIFDVNSYNVNYRVVNRDAPVALQQMTSLIGKNVGNASTVLLEGLYNKSVGLTSRELITILDPQAQTTELGQILSGAEGGRLTKLINYAYLSGLVHKLSYYSNSYQVPNFFVSPSPPINLAFLVGIIDQLIFAIDLTVTNFVNALEYSTPSDTNTLYPFENIANLYNKNLSEASYIVKNLTAIGGDLSNLGNPVASPLAEIVGSPGIGNSPVPESISKINSITPEQSNQLAPMAKNNFSFVANRKNSPLLESQVLEKFMSFIEDNKKIAGVSETTNIVQQVTNYSNVVVTTSKEKTAAAELQASGAGTSLNNQAQQESLSNKRNVKAKNLLSVSNKIASEEAIKTVNSLVKQNLIQPFSTVESCKAFGGTKCEQRFSLENNSCGDPTNKAIYSSRDSSPSTTKENGSVFVDRPFGDTIPNRNTKFFIPDGENNKPAYFNVFNGTEISITDNGNPIFEKIFSEPIVFTKGGKNLAEDIELVEKTSVDTGAGESVLLDVKVGQDGVANTNTLPELEKYYSSYYNSEFGLIEAIKANWERDDSFNCALLDDPYAYQACMNLLKCKRFKRVNDAPFLDFCPRTLAGGLFK